MASCPNLNEEDETEQNGNLIRSSEVGPKQAVRQRHDHKGRDELPQIEGCGEQGHDATFVGRAEFFVGQPQPHHHDGNQTHEIDQEGVVPLNRSQICGVVSSTKL